MKKRLIVKNIGCLATPLGREPHAGKMQGEISFIKNAYVVADDGIITEVGNGEPAEDYFVNADVVDADGRLVTPGLIDSHTHLVFGGWRQHEMEQKLKGASYLEILASGGGILSTVKATRETSQEELIEKTEKILREMFRFGTTTCEAKSGYGLDRETELKQLTVVREINQKIPMGVVPTFMGAHALPEEYKDAREAYIELICNEMLPEIAEKKLSEFCDVFCEKGVFTADESLKILNRAKSLGLIPKIHTDEIFDIGGTEVAREIGAISAEHLIKCSSQGIENLKRGGVIACLLPCTSLYLGVDFAPAREMIEADVPVAIATDFNPGSCPCGNIQLAMNMGCLKYKMTPEEVLTAVTINAASAIKKEEMLGTVEKGKQADMVIWDAPDLNYIFYRMGSNIASVIIKKGIVYGQDC